MSTITPLEQQAGYLAGEIGTREARLLRIDEQLGAASSKAKSFADLAGLEMERRIVADELGSLRESLAAAERALAAARQAAQDDANLVRGWWQALGALQALADNPRLRWPGETVVSDTAAEMMQRAVAAAVALRARGEAVPDTLTITLPLQLAAAPDTLVMPAPERAIRRLWPHDEADEADDLSPAA